MSEQRRLRDESVIKASAYWYACGYNDHRSEGEPFIAPFAFADHWLSIVATQESHRSLQDTFALFVKLVTT